MTHRRYTVKPLLEVTPKPVLKAVDQLATWLTACPELIDVATQNDLDSLTQTLWQVVNLLCEQQR